MQVGRKKREVRRTVTNALLRLPGDTPSIGGQAESPSFRRPACRRSEICQNLPIRGIGRLREILLETASFRQSAHRRRRSFRKKAHARKRFQIFVVKSRICRIFWGEYPQVHPVALDQKAPSVRLY